MVLQAPAIPGLMTTCTWDGKMYSNGWKASRNGTADVTDKSTGEVLATVAQAGSQEVGAACKTAILAGIQWAAIRAEQRASILRKAAELLENYKEEAIYWLVRESGSTRTKANDELLGSRAHLSHSADVAMRPSKQVLKDDDEMLSYCERVPLGVVGVIGPFNYPLILSLRFVAAALAMGNSVVLKPSLNTAVCGGILTRACSKRPVCLKESCKLYLATPKPAPRL